MVQYTANPSRLVRECHSPARTLRHPSAGAELRLPQRHDRRRRDLRCAVRRRRQCRCLCDGAVACVRIGIHTLFEEDRRLAEVTIMHELLHGLGLDESPPASDAITARVHAWCG